MKKNSIYALIAKLYFAFKLFHEIDLKIIFVDDGSTDDTLPLLIGFSENNPDICYISFSRNFGKDNAIVAGLRASNSDPVITMDADLQHSPSLIPDLIFNRALRPAATSTNRSVGWLFLNILDDFYQDFKIF